jgi:hypothetical protein
MVFLKKLIRHLFGSQLLRLSFLLLVTAIALSSCEKKGEVVVKNNEPPPDATISNVTINNYVNRVYISVLGREPDSTERTHGFNILRQNDVSAASRSQFLDSVFTKPEYYDHLYDLARIDLLNNLDTSEITLYIAIFTPLLSDSAYVFYWDGIKNEIARLKALQRVPADLHNHVIDVTGMNRRCVNNYFYDQINMGSENFVVSVFQHFLSRYPTINELNNGVLMVNGGVGNLFLQSGQSKDDFLNVFFSSADYYEGAIRLLYKRYLFREPNSVEMNAATRSYQSSKDYIKAQKDILSANEYIGI